jgi:hypothetical protein
MKYMPGKLIAKITFDAHTLVFYPVVKGVKSATPTNFNIDSLSATALTISTYFANPAVSFQVFLSR